MEHHSPRERRGASPTVPSPRRPPVAHHGTPERNAPGMSLDEIQRERHGEPDDEPRFTRDRAPARTASRERVASG